MSNQVNFHNTRGKGAAQQQSQVQAGPGRSQVQASVAPIPTFVGPRAFYRNNGFDRRMCAAAVFALNPYQEFEYGTKGEHMKRLEQNMLDIRDDNEAPNGIKVGHKTMLNLIADEIKEKEIRDTNLITASGTNLMFLDQDHDRDIEGCKELKAAAELEKDLTDQQKKARQEREEDMNRKATQAREDAFRGLSKPSSATPVRQAPCARPDSRNTEGDQEPRDMFLSPGTDSTDGSQSGSAIVQLVDVIGTSQELQSKIAQEELELKRSRLKQEDENETKRIKREEDTEVRRIKIQEDQHALEMKKLANDADAEAKRIALENLKEENKLEIAKLNAASEEKKAEAALVAAKAQADLTNSFMAFMMQQSQRGQGSSSSSSSST